MHEIRAISELFAPTAPPTARIPERLSARSAGSQEGPNEPRVGNPNSNANQVMTVSFQH